MCWIKSEPLSLKPCQVGHRCRVTVEAVKLEESRSYKIGFAEFTGLIKRKSTYLQGTKVMVDTVACALATQRHRGYHLSGLDEFA